MVILLLVSYLFIVKVFLRSHYDFFYFIGISRVASSKYVICTLDGVVQNVNVNVTDRKLIFTDLECNINSSKYAVYGVSSSKCEAFYMFALYPRVVGRYYNAKLQKVSKLNSFFFV